MSPDTLRIYCDVCEGGTVARDVGMGPCSACDGYGWRTVRGIREALEYALMFADVFAAVSENHPHGNINAVIVAQKCRAALKLLPDGRVTDHDPRD